MSTQPQLPAPTAPSVIELAYIEDSPPGLWPDNQDSNFGVHRKIFCDALLDAVTQLQTIFNEMFPDTAVAYLNNWEEEMGLTVNPPGRTLTQRQGAVVARSRRGAFTRTGRNKIIENYISATFGSSLSFGTTGIVLGSGVSLHSGVTSIVGTYRVYENIRGFSYIVYIKNTVTPDISSLTRELLRITPSGITFTIDNTQADVLRYSGLVLNDAPIGYWRMGTVNDNSGNGNALTPQGGVTVGSVAAPGLLTGAAAGGEGATTFDGINDYFSAVMAGVPAPITKSLEGWGRLTAVPGAGVNCMIVSTGSLEYISIYGTTAGNLVVQFTCNIDGVQYYLESAPGAVALNTLYHIVGTFDGLTMKLYVNGVLINSANHPGRLSTVNANNVSIGEYTGGGTNYWKGPLDEVAIYDHALDPAVVLDHYNTGRDIATY